MLTSRQPTTHGAVVTVVVVRNENNQKFRSLEREHSDHDSPVAPTERKLVEEIAIGDWRQRRVWAIGTVRTSIPLKNFADNSISPQPMDRYETRLSRQYDPALRPLFDLQDHRPRDKQKLPNELDRTAAPRPTLSSAPPPLAPQPQPQQKLQNEPESNHPVTPASIALVLQMPRKPKLPNEPDNNRNVGRTPAPATDYTALTRH